MGAMPRVTVADLIETAGGPAKLGALLGVARTTVCGWQASGTIPGLRAAQIAIVLGIPADDLLPLIQGPRSKVAA